MRNPNSRQKLAVLIRSWFCIGLVLMASPAMAHCDSEDGPIIPAIRAALADGAITPLLKWISPADEAEITDLFGKVRVLRTQSPEAQAMADRHFTETFIRLHRAAEGAPYSGLKPAGAVPPVIVAADKALESGHVEKLADELARAVRDKLMERFEHAAELRRHQDESVAAGREYVEAYVAYVHFVEGLHDYLQAPGGHTHSDAETTHDHNSQPRSQNMESIQLDETVGAIVTRQPQLSRIFEDFGIDYCCGGKVPLGEACRKEGLDPQQVLARLEVERAHTSAAPPSVDAAAMSLTQLADHIEQTHHVYLRSELPRLMMMAEKVANVHGAHDPRLPAVRDTVGALVAELSSHMMKEEHILFPMIRQMEMNPAAAADSAAMIAGPIRQMEVEHDMAGLGLERLTQLTDGYTAPEWACNTYRAFLDGLRRFEGDLHQHIHKENNVLFPRALNGAKPEELN